MGGLPGEGGINIPATHWAQTPLAVLTMEGRQV